MAGEGYVLLGGGGFAIELTEYMLSDGIKPVGYYDLEEDKDLSQYIPWLGDEHENYRSDVWYLVASGQPKLRRKMIDFLNEHSLMAGSFVSSRAYVSRMAIIGRGAIITPGACISGNPVVGDFLLMNLQSCVAHHGRIGDNVVLGPGVIVAGHCVIENDACLHTQSCVVPDGKVEAAAVVGVGSVVFKKARAATTVFGNPAMPLI